MIPVWATYTATNYDGTVYAFSGEPGLFNVEGEQEQVWEPRNDDDCFQLISRGYPYMFWRESAIKI